jgi:alkylation response protein AidB-like acyl-CoA dehydrogenase
MTAPTTSPAVTVPGSAELVTRAHDLKRRLSKNVAPSEADRGVVEESNQAITDDGLFNLAVPKPYGGFCTPTGLPTTRRGRQHGRDAAD